MLQLVDHYINFNPPWLPMDNKFHAHAHINKAVVAEHCHHASLSSVDCIFHLQELCRLVCVNDIFFGCPIGRWSSNIDHPCSSLPFHYYWCSLLSLRSSILFLAGSFVVCVIILGILASVLICLWVVIHSPIRLCGRYAYIVPLKANWIWGVESVLVGFYKVSRIWMIQARLQQRMMQIPRPKKMDILNLVVVLLAV